jgi:hypothetical protein
MALSRVSKLHSTIYKYLGTFHNLEVKHCALDTEGSYHHLRTMKVNKEQLIIDDK